MVGGQMKSSGCTICFQPEKHLLSATKRPFSPKNHSGGIISVISRFICLKAEYAFNHNRSPRFSGRTWPDLH